MAFSSSSSSTKMYSVFASSSSCVLLLLLLASAAHVHAKDASDSETECSSLITACAQFTECQTALSCVNNTRNTKGSCDGVCFTTCSQVSNPGAVAVWQNLSLCLLDHGGLVAGDGADQSQKIYRIRTALGIVPLGTYLTAQQTTNLKTAFLNALQLLGFSAADATVSIDLDGSIYVDRFTRSSRSEVELEDEAEHTITSDFTLANGTVVPITLTSQASTQAVISGDTGAASDSGSGFFTTTVIIVICVSVVVLILLVVVVVYTHSQYKRAAKMNEDVETSHVDLLGRPVSTRGSTMKGSTMGSTAKKFPMKQTSFFDRIK